MIKCSFCLENIEEKATAPKCGHVGCPPCWEREFGEKKVCFFFFFYFFNFFFFFFFFFSLGSCQSLFVINFPRTYTV